MRSPRLFLGLMTVLLLATTQASAVEEVFSPVQAAYFKSETLRADERFITEVARITASPVALVRKAMPTEGRITDPAARVIAAIEAQRKIVVSDVQRKQIAGAEQERRSAIALARVSARTR